MALEHSWFFTKTIIDWNTISEATHNKYMVTFVKEYKDKKGDLGEGYILTLQIIEDDFDYGVDKQGNPRENNLFNSFDVAVLSTKVKPKKGDYVSLHGFRQDVSYAFNFNLMLRFDEIKLIEKGSKND